MKPFVILGLRETYAQTGDFDVKIVLDKKKFDNGDALELELQDSDGKHMNASIDIWGRKIRLGFKIDQKTSDGIANCHFSVCDREGVFHEGNFNFWVIK